MAWNGFFRRMWIARSLERHPRLEVLLKSWDQEVSWVAGEREAEEKASEVGGEREEKRCLAVLPARTREREFCPGTKGGLCCGYRVLQPMAGCPFSCRYCVLRAYFPRAVVRYYLREETVSWPPLSGLRWGTGEWSDSLACGDMGGMLGFLAEYARREEVLLELKTKSVEIGFLLERPRDPYLLPSWSLNPARLIEEEETGTATLMERLDAMLRCQEQGYPVGIHLDPIFPEAEAQYHEMLDEMERILRPERVAWISLGVLRFPSGEWEWWRSDPFLAGRLAEMEPGNDGKWRYPQPHRIAVLRAIGRRLQRWAPEAVVYLCMESPVVWEEALGTDVECRSIGKRLDNRARALLSERRNW